MQDIILFGCGGHAKSVVDAIEAAGEYHILGFIGKEISDFEYRGYKVIATDEDVTALYQKGIRKAHIAIGYLGKKDIRHLIYNQLKDAGFELPVIIDPSAIVSGDVQIAEGTFVGKGAIINSGTVIGKNAIINSGSIVEHDCCVGDFTHISVGASICGNVKVGGYSFVGAGSVLIQEVIVGNKVLIGAGSTIRKSVDDRKIVFTEKVVKIVDYVGE